MYININIYICTTKTIKMKKKPISWQLSETTIAKVKKEATRDKVAIQVKAEQLLIIALEGKHK